MNRIDLKRLASYDEDFALWSAEQAALLRAQGTEALAAAKQASARRRQEIDREIAAAMGRDAPAE